MLLVWIIEHGLKLNLSKSHVTPITRSSNPVSLLLSVDGSPLATELSLSTLMS